MSDRLNPQQQEAVRYLDGPLLVLAGAGSGKTRVITRKIAYLVQSCGYDPRSVAAITFTNKAAKEMRERAGKLLEGKSAKGLTVCTFHALGLQMLREEAARAGLKPRFSVLDAQDALALAAEAGKAGDKREARAIHSRISRWKNDLVTPEAALASAADESELRAARAYAAYGQTLAAYQAVDFDDLIRLPVELFRRDGEALAKWQGRLRYLLVDEYQDTNHCQYELLRLLAGPRGAFTAVGDDDQAIYAWRGASADNIRRLSDEWPRLEVIKLEQNYRSAQRILRVANSLIANNAKLYDKKLWSELGMGDFIHVAAARDDEAEAESVVGRLLGHKFETRTKFSDYAILYRGNHQSRPFEEQLRAHNAPYVVSGGQSFFDRAEIRDICAYLRLVANGDDDPAFIRAATTPKRGIGPHTLEALGAWAGERHRSLFEAAFEMGLRQRLAAKQLEALEEFCEWMANLQSRAAREPCGQVLEDMLRAIAYEAWLFDSEEPRAAETKWANVRQFTDWLSRKGEEDGKNLVELTQTVALMNMLEGRDNEHADAVRLSTLHAAKGLEFPWVFLVGVEEGLLPHRESADGDRIEEERRLMYVGITRAQRGLFISHCEKRKRAGGWEPCERSRFIDELSQEDLRVSGRGEAPAVGKQEGMAKLANLKALLGGG